MFGMESTENLYFSVSAGQLGRGLDEQLAKFVVEHPDTKLIIIDTLQKVREIGGDNYSYANDYQIITRLKSFADMHGLCLLLVHHTRKQTSDDKFDMISGTSGLLGAADVSFWEGSATELVALLNADVQVNIITKRLNILAGRLYDEHGIHYKKGRCHEGRKIILWKDAEKTA